MSHIWIKDDEDQKWLYYFCENCKLEKVVATEMHSPWAKAKYGYDILFFENGRSTIYASEKEPSCAEIIMNQVMQ